MEFRVLGPLEVIRDGAPIRLPGEKERAVLSLLLIRAPMVVSTDALIEVLWGDEPPAHPNNALQSVMSRLRKALGTGAPLVTRAPGYLLDVDNTQLDARRFESLVRRAAGVASTDPWTAGRVLDDALALWRGPPLADTTYWEFAQPEIGRLEELRLGAVEDRLEAELAQGRHAEVVAELEKLAGEHPRRERLWGQLMVALYRSGRQADALDVYQHVRHVLNEELGLEPGRELADLERRILQQDQGLRLPALATTRPRHNLPARLTSFIGRRAEQQAVSTLLQSHRLVTITGPGGVGKTSLAVEVGRGLIGSFERGVCFADLSPVADPSRLASAVLAAVGLRRSGAQADAASGDAFERLVEYLGCERVLVILDNCEHLIDGCARLIGPLLSSCPELVVLATSRELLGLTGESLFPLAPLSLPPPEADDEEREASDAVRLFAERASAVRPGFAVTDSPGTVAQICRRLDGMPLAIELAAARVRSLPMTEIARRLDDRFGLLTNGSRAAAPRQQTLRAAIDWSYDLLFDVERTLFARLSVFAGSWDLAAAEAVCSDRTLPAVDVMDVLSRLADRSLVSTVDEGRRFRLLETIRDYARQRLVAAGEADELQRRHADYFLAVAEAAGAQPATPDRLAALDDAADDIRAAFDWALRANASVTVLRFAGALGWYWATWQQEEGQHRIEALARLLDGRPSIELARALQASAFVESYAPSPATRDRAATSAELLERFGDPAAAARSRLIWAFIELMQSGDGRRVEELTSSALELASTAGDPWGEAVALLTRFRCRLRSGSVHAAIEAGREALVRFRELDDAWGMPWTIIWLAFATRLSGNIAVASGLLEEAVASADRLPYIACLAHGELGGLTALRGDHARAGRHFERAVALAPDTGVRDALPTALDAAGFGTRLRGNAGEAARLHRRALVLHDQLGSDVGLAHGLACLGFAEFRLSHPQGARRSLAESLRLAHKTGRLDLAAAAYEGLACTLAARNAEAAAVLLGGAKAIRDRTGMQLTLIEGHDPAEAEVSLRAALGAARLAECLADGMRSSVDELAGLV